MSRKSKFPLKEIAKYLVAGKSNQEIAEVFGLTNKQVVAIKVQKELKSWLFKLRYEKEAY